MERAVEQVFTKEIMEKALGAFKLDVEYKKLGSFENYVFEVFKNRTPYILRITHRSHRLEEEIISELDWVNYLHGYRIRVPRAYESINGKVVEPILATDGSYFYACLFEKAKGSAVRFADENFNEKLFYNWGKTTAQMHEATMKYEPSPGVRKRDTWENDDILKIDKYIPAGEMIVFENAKQLLSEIHNLPKSKENFGLIHTDLHSGNFFYDGEEIHVFDFDDGCYHWFTSDIAIPLYYSTLWGKPDANKEERTTFAKTFITAFIAGYESVKEAPADWEEHLPLFLRLRDLELYLVFNKKVPVEERNEKERKMLEEIRERLEKKEEPVEID